MLASVPARAFRGATSRVRIVEAVTQWPHRESYVWRTDAAHLDDVLERVAARLARGEIAQPEAAVFAGLRRG